MSEQIREQVSAFLDGELPNSETELLLKRLTRDAVLRESFGRYALIGESLRGGSNARLSQGFTARVNRAIDGESQVADIQIPNTRMKHWWRPFAGAAVAAGVAAVAVFSYQQRADAPTLVAALPMTALNGAVAKPKELLSYTVPATVAEPPAFLPAARLTNYVFAHSKYSSALGQSNVLSGLLTDADEPDADAAAAANSRAVNDAALKQSKSRDARVAP
jgi:sigma-E factor negative regulatory protein RseA